LLAVILTAQAIHAQNTASGDILLKLKKLNTVGSVLYVAAHPDDENTKLLTWLANERKLRTGYLSLTRGDGGQNLIGKEQGEMLGLIRTQELLAARRTDGAEQFFSRAFDFGFSKNPEETFTFWNRESVLSDVVWTIRKFKPDVIICRFPTTGEGGHGHHTASAILALEAFTAAADPNRFPEQLRYVQVWQAKRIFWNTFNFGGLNTTSPDQLKVDVGGYNPLLGKSYGEIASDSRTMHKSQGFGSARTRGESLEYFKFLKGDTAKTDLFDGVNQTWTRFAATAPIKKMVDDCILHYNAAAPERSIPALTAIYKKLQQLDEKDADLRYWKVQKLKEARQLIESCAGLWIESNSLDYTAIPGKQIQLNTQIVSRNKADKIRLTGYSYIFGDHQRDIKVDSILRTDVAYSFRDSMILAGDIPYTTPYWLRTPHTTGSFIVTDPLLIGLPENEDVPQVVYHLSFNGLALDIPKKIVYKSTDPVKGEIYRPLEILPPATINIAEPVYMFAEIKSKKVKLVVKANTDKVTGTVSLSVPPNWTVEIKKPDFTLASKGDEAVIDAVVSPMGGATEGTVLAHLYIDDKSYNQSIRRINYDHIPAQFTLNESSARLVKVALQKAGTNIGYIPGAGDDIPASLKQIGYHVTILTDELLATEDLSDYDAIVTGVRAYNTSDKLQLHYNKLMKYVRNGGNLVVQYNTNNRIGPVLAKIGPYPFTITRDRVTDEKAEMRFTNAQHAVLNYPNKITERDFDNWIQERGIYFATDLDKHYQTVFSINDPKEKPSEGSLIVAPYGKGNFVYTGLVFFRELPAGVPGAYRLFVNLLSIPQNNTEKE